MAKTDVLSTLPASPPPAAPLDGQAGLAGRVAAAKQAYTVRHVDTSAATRLLVDGTPRAGDLLLARVTEIGHHARLELGDGRRAVLFPGDEVLVAYGNRYAPDQFHALVPQDLGPCHLAAAGGVASLVTDRHETTRPPTCLEPLGLLVGADGERLALAPVDEGQQPGSGQDLEVVLVVGSAMNAGKSTTVATLTRGLRAAGRRVGAAKVTGTGAGGDAWLFADAGADEVRDFTWAGLPSTYLAGHESVVATSLDLLDRLATAGCDVAVVEVADGVFAEETGALVCDSRFRALVGSVVFAAADALGASCGVGWCLSRSLPLVGVAGLLSGSPLAAAEAVRVTGARVLTLAELGAADIAEVVLPGGQDPAAPAASTIGAHDPMQVVGAVAERPGRVPVGV